MSTSTPLSSASDPASTRGRARVAFGRTFQSLATYNFRLFFLGLRTLAVLARLTLAGLRLPLARFSAVADRLRLGRRNVLGPGLRLDRESAAVVFDQPDHARRHHAVESGDDRGGYAARPGVDDRADRCKWLHPGEIPCGAAPPSEALRQDNTR